jgi:hypothetical protein
MALSLLDVQRMYNTANAVEGKVRLFGDQAFRRRTMTKRAWLLFGLGASLAYQMVTLFSSRDPILETWPFRAGRRNVVFTGIEGISRRARHCAAAGV